LNEVKQANATYVAGWQLIWNQVYFDFTRNYILIFV
jgi:hypothetical protein